MKRKQYVILASFQENHPGRITIPIKAVTNLFTHKGLQFAGGYPAIFGGNQEDNESAVSTLRREVTEESTGTIALSNDIKSRDFFFIRQVTEGDNEMNLWFTTKWALTKKNWNPKPDTYAQGEMLRTATLDLSQITDFKSTDAILNQIVTLSGAPGGSEKQCREFYNSATAIALIQFVCERRDAIGMYQQQSLTAKAS